MGKQVTFEWLLPRMVNHMGCHQEGISGNCGYDCPVLQVGECPSQEELIEDGKFTDEDLIELVGIILGED